MGEHVAHAPLRRRGRDLVHRRRGGITHERARTLPHFPVRRGMPMGVGGLLDVVKTPQYATGVGLTLYGVRHTGVLHFQRGESDKRTVWKRMRNWFGEVF